jgi:nicotinate-nucleotide--dimethylbenzimidazole phosphoribosyltransferase
MTSPAQTQVEDTLAAITPLHTPSVEDATIYHQSLTKPIGSLGRLESIGATLCGIQRQVPPVIDQTHVVIFAADHGITKSHSLGPFPREVTAQMVRNFLNGGAAINAIANVVGADVAVVNMGVDADLSDIQSDRFYAHAVALGSGDISQGAAMTEAQLYQALAAGIAMAEHCYAQGSKAVALGEMGIGNTTIASAMTAAFLQLSPESITGRGTGSDDATLARKVKAIEQALVTNSVKSGDGFDVLRKLGGFELAGICGMALGLSRRGIAVVADGFISTAAVLAAVKMCPLVRDYVFVGHQSTEPGHEALVNALDARPLLDLEFRLGEGTGACLSLTLLKSAATVMSQMATFESAAVENKTS